MLCWDIFMGDPCSLSWELLEATALSCLAPAWAALRPCSCQACTLLMGAWPCHGLSISRLNLRLASSLGRCCSLLWFHCACQAGLGRLSSSGAVLQQRMMDDFSTAGELNRQESLRMTFQAPWDFKHNPSLQESSYCLKWWIHTMASTSSKTQKGLGSRACAAAKGN